MVYISSRLTFVDFPAYLQLIPKENKSCAARMDQVKVSNQDSIQDSKFGVIVDNTTVGWVWEALLLLDWSCSQLQTIKVVSPLTTYMYLGTGMPEA